MFGGPERFRTQQNETTQTGRNNYIDELVVTLLPLLLRSGLLVRPALSVRCRWLFAADRLVDAAAVKHCGW